MTVHVGVYHNRRGSQLLKEFGFLGTVNKCQHANHHRDVELAGDHLYQVWVCYYYGIHTYVLKV